MNHEEYEVMYQVEDHHWWYLGMERITRRVLERYLPRDGSALKILDAGCGTGAVMKYLCKYGDVTGFDFSREALRFSRQRGLTRLTQASVIDIPFADQQFDLIVSFDVICEMGIDEGVALRECQRILKPGGLVVLRLPAYDWLRGKHDQATHIRHRFTRGELAVKLRQSGLQPVHLSYANTILFPLVVLKRLSERVLRFQQTGSDLTLDPGPMNGVLCSILSAEAPLVSAVGLPFGLTVVALARKDV
jgi:ubiquinone/menaquinone biosynthesis C-methylase UbiE